MKKYITFCGHSHIEEWDIVGEKLIEAIEKIIDSSDGVEISFLCGGYGDFDLISAKAIDKIKKSYPNNKMKKILILPYNEENGNLKLQKIISEYDDTFFPQSLAEIPSKYAIVYRNRWMIDHSNVVIAYISHEFGGAYKTFDYAKNLNNKIIINLATESLRY